MEKLMIKSKTVGYLFIGVIFSFYSCNIIEGIRNEKPDCTIKSPSNNDLIVKGELIDILIEANDTDGEISKITLYIDDSKHFTFYNEPYIYEWNTIYFALGSHTIKAIAEDNLNETEYSEISVTLIVDESNWETGTVTDYDGNTYTTIKIGNQWWMAENLKVSNYSNGVIIPKVIENSDWGDLEISDTAYCFPENGIYSYDSIYGALYTWAAASGGQSSDSNPSGVQGVCPDGWHLPSRAEWTELINFLGGSEIAGGKMKTIGTEFWTTPNRGATNESGFSALPAGMRNGDCTVHPYGDCSGLFWDMKNMAEFWTTTEISNYQVYKITLDNNNSGVNNWSVYPKNYGFSVRCIKND